MVGTVGQILGDAGVNIAGMQVSRSDKGGQALVALSVDSAIPAETLAEIETAIDALRSAPSTWSNQTWSPSTWSPSIWSGPAQATRTRRVAPAERRPTDRVQPSYD